LQQPLGLTEAINVDARISSLAGKGKEQEKAFTRYFCMFGFVVCGFFFNLK